MQNYKKSLTINLLVDKNLVKQSVKNMVFAKIHLHTTPHCQI
jgi:hypothetical protein